METRVSLKYFVNSYLWKHSFGAKSPPDPTKFNFVKGQISTIKLQKSAKISLTLYLFLRSFE